MNNTDIAPTRRAVIGALGIIAAAPAVAIAGPLVAKPDPVSAYWTAMTAFNAHRISEGEYLKALDDLDFSDPQTERDFIRKFLAMFEGLSAPSDERLELLMMQGKRLIGEA